MTPAEAGKLGGLDRWGRTVDRCAATVPARRAAERRWADAVRAEFPQADEQTVMKMAEARRKAFFVRLAQASVAARKVKRGR